MAQVAAERPAAGVRGAEVRDVASAIRRVYAPVLMAAGGRDRLIPRSSTAALYAAAAEPKQWVDVPDVGHNGIFESAEFWSALGRFLARVLACGEVHAESAAGPFRKRRRPTP